MYWSEGLYFSDEIRIRVRISRIVGYGAEQGILRVYQLLSQGRRVGEVVAA